MQLIFFGSSPFSVIVLQKLIDSNLPIQAVVTTPDKPTGRHLVLTPNPVKTLAQKENLQVYENLSELQNINLNNSIGLVAAYGKIIPQSLIEKFSSHLYNIHPSLLPKYRGASPLQFQLLNNETSSGVTIIQLDSQMDHGPIINVSNYQISPSDNWITLGEKLFTQGTSDFISIYPHITTIIGKVQDENLATYTKKLTREDGFLTYEQFLIETKNNQPSPNLIQKFKAFYSWPGIWTINPQNKRIKLTSIDPITIKEEGR